MTHEEYLAHKKAVRERMIREGMTPPPDGVAETLDWTAEDERARDCALDKLGKEKSHRSTSK